LIYFTPEGVVFRLFKNRKRYLSNGCPIETVILDMEERE